MSQAATAPAVRVAGPPAVGGLGGSVRLSRLVALADGRVVDLVETMTPAQAVRLATALLVEAAGAAGDAQK